MRGNCTLIKAIFHLCESSPSARQRQNTFTNSKWYTEGFKSLMKFSIYVLVKTKINKETLLRKLNENFRFLGH